MAAPDAHRDKRAKAGPVLYPMDEPLLRKCDALMKNLAKKSQARKTLRTQKAHARRVTARIVVGRSRPYPPEPAPASD